MDQKTLKGLKERLLNDDDFYSIYESSIYDYIFKTNNVICEIVYDARNQGEKRFFNTYKKFLYNFLDSMFHDGTLGFYVLDKRFLDIAYCVINDEIINLDDLYQDFKNYL